MATGGESEDSGHLFVSGPSGSNMREFKSNVRRTNTVNEYSSIKTMNRNLNKKIETLKQEIKEQTMDFHAQKMELVRNHKRETDNLKKIHEKTLERVHSKNCEIEKQAEEIKKLKLKIELLEKSEKELREKVERAKQDEKHKIEYEKLSREMTASKKEIERLREQITLLENEVAEKEQKIMAEKEKKEDLSAEIGTIAKQHKADMTAMKNDLMGKMDENQKNSQEMIHGLFQRMEQLIIHGQNGQVRERERNHSFEQRQNTLPPIHGSATRNRRDTFDKWMP